MGSMGGAALIAGHPDRATVTLLRSAAPVQNERGVYEAQSPAESSLVVMMHPLSAESQALRREANRVEATIEIYSTSELFVARGSVAADRIRRGSKTYTIVDVDEQAAGDVWLAFAVLEEPTS